MLALAIAAVALPGAQTPPTLPNQFLVAEVVAELNGMVDKYRTLVGANLPTTEKQLKVRKVNLVSFDGQFMFVKLDVRVREIGVAGLVLSTKDGSARGKFRWGSVTPEKACVTAGMQEFSCLAVTSMSNVPNISGQAEQDAARRAIMANFPREVCALMWPTIRVAGSIFPEKTKATTKHGSRANDLIFAVTLSNHSARNVKVKYGTQDGTAKAGIDYRAAAGELLIPNGTKIMRIVVPIIPRDGNQGARQMVLNLWSPINGKIVDNKAIGVILDTGQTVPSGPIPPSR